MFIISVIYAVVFENYNGEENMKRKYQSILQFKIKFVESAKKNVREIVHWQTFKARIATKDLKRNRNEIKLFYLYSFLDYCRRQRHSPMNHLKLVMNELRL